jgi:hypothetical protein
MPTCLRLNGPQTARLARFQVFLTGLPGWDEACEEDCSCASPITFTIYATGLGDVIRAAAMGRVCELTIDDDGDLCGDENWQ